MDGSYANGFAPRDGLPLYPELWQGCVGAWNPGLGPTGLTLRDWSGYGIHGTLTNMASDTAWVRNQGKTALNFDGSNDSVIASALTIGAVEGTISTWVRPDTWTGNATIFSMRTTDFLEALHNGGTLLFRYGNGSAGTSLTLPTVGVWSHLAFVYNTASGLQYYINGNLSLSTNPTWPAIDVGGNLVIGNLDGSNLPFDGLISDFRVYIRAISTSEIRLLASRPGIAYERTLRRRSSAAVAAFNRRRRLLVGAGV